MIGDKWMRKIQVDVAGRGFEYPGLNIEFRVDFDLDEEADTAEIDIYNLSEDSRNRIKKGEPVSLSAGYQQDMGTVFLGVIEDVLTERRQADVVTTIEAIDASEDWMHNKYSASYKDGIKASAVLRDLLDKTGLEIGELDLPDDKTYTNGKAVSGRIKESVGQVARDCGARLHVVNGAVFITSKEYKQDVGLLLNKDTGLIGSPQRVDTDDAEWEVTCLFDHRLRAGAGIRIESNTANGDYAIVSGEHRPDYTTVLQVVSG